jgi:hypothetical protein
MNMQTLKDYELSTIGWLSFPFKTAAVFTRTDFGLSAITPGTLIGSAIAFCLFHETYSMFVRTHDRPFFDGIGLLFTIAFCGMGLIQILISWLMYRRGRPQFSESLGTPFLTSVFRLPYRLAWLLDIAFIFWVGVEMHPVDVALSVWLMFGAVGGLMIFTRGTQQQFRDRLNMIDAQLYSGQVTSDVKKRTGKAQRAVKESALPDLPTGV